MHAQLELVTTSAQNGPPLKVHNKSKQAVCWTEQHIQTKQPTSSSYNHTGLGFPKQDLDCHTNNRFVDSDLIFAPPTQENTKPGNNTSVEQDRDANAAIL